MINIKNGNILSNVTSGWIFHQVNCQGKMASGIAWSIKSKYPKVYEEYLKFIGNSENKDLLVLGRCQEVKVTPELSIVNCFGQLYYGNDGQRYTDYAALKTAFKEFLWLKKDLDIKSVIENCHFPYKIGCALGGGNFDIVSRLVEFYFPAATFWKL